MSGRVVPLLQREGSGFKIDESAFDDILSQSDLLDRKLVVLSIVGEYRRGKSFFLNFLLKYLVNQVRLNFLYIILYWYSNP